MRSAAAAARQSANTALIDGVRKFAMDVRELDIDLIDRINPFGEAYAILAKAMTEDSLKQVAGGDCRQARQPHPRGGAESSPSAPCNSRRNADACLRSPRLTPGKSAWPRAWLSLRA